MRFALTSHGCREPDLRNRAGFFIPTTNVQYFTTSHEACPISCGNFQSRVLKFFVSIVDRLFDGESVGGVGFRLFVLMNPQGWVFISLSLVPKQLKVNVNAIKDYKLIGVLKTY